MPAAGVTLAACHGYVLSGRPPRTGAVRIARLSAQVAFGSGTYGVYLYHRTALDKRKECFLVTMAFGPGWM